MGAKTSKSANITSTPKKEAVVAAVEVENRVNGVGETKVEVIKEANNTVNHVIEVPKEEAKEIVKEIQETANEVIEKIEKEIEKEPAVLVVEQNGDTEKENKTPVKEGEEKPEKKKVMKRFSLRKLSFLRREKKPKEDKHKNGDVTSPEKKEADKEGEVEVVAEDGQGDAKTTAEEIKSEETKTETKKEDETPVVAAEKVEETKPAESKPEESAKVEEKTETVAVPLENIQNGHDEIPKEVGEIIEKKIDSTTEPSSNAVKEVNEILSAVENGIDEKLSKEVSVAD